MWRCYREQTKVGTYACILYGHVEKGSSTEWASKFLIGIILKISPSYQGRKPKHGLKTHSLTKDKVWGSHRSCKVREESQKREKHREGAQILCINCPNSWMSPEWHICRKTPDFLSRIKELHWDFRALSLSSA